MLAARIPAAAQVSSACLIRPGATTHSSDTEQRLVDIPIRVTAADTIELHLPNAPTLAPPGWYLLFVVTASRVPSEGRWVHLSA